MKKKDEDFARVCALCEKAMILGDKEHVLCSKKGIVACEFTCRKFIYDPLKRTPAKMPELPEIDDDGEPV